MTRQIKFRGKDTETGEWRYGSLVLIDYHNSVDYVEACVIVLPNHHTFDVDPNTVGQFTGKLDKNGCEIFEGDIFPCVYAFDGCTEHVMHIEYDIPGAGFFPRWDYTKCHQKGVTKSMHNLTRLEIIGNIHDNPELLNPNNNE